MSLALESSLLFLPCCYLPHPVAEITTLLASSIVGLRCLSLKFTSTGSYSLGSLQSDFFPDFCEVWETHPPWCNNGLCLFIAQEHS